MVTGPTEVFYAIRDADSNEFSAVWIETQLVFTASSSGCQCCKAGFPDRATKPGTASRLERAVCAAFSAGGPLEGCEKQPNPSVPNGPHDDTSLRNAPPQPAAGKVCHRGGSIRSPDGNSALRVRHNSWLRRNLLIDIGFLQSL